MASPLPLPLTVTYVFATIILASTAGWESTFLFHYLITSASPGNTNTQSGGRKPIQYARLLQIACHASSLTMTTLGLVQMILDLVQIQFPLALGSLYAISDFLFYLFSSIYYLEILSVMSALFLSRYLRPTYIRYYQMTNVFFNFAFGFGYCFRDTLYIDTNNGTYNWAQGWAQATAIVVVENSLLGIGIAFLIFQSLLIHKKNKDGRKAATLNALHVKRMKVLLGVFVFLQLMVFVLYGLYGTFVRLASPFSEPMLGISISISGLELCVFSRIFNVVRDWMAQKGSGDQDQELVIDVETGGGGGGGKSENVELRGSDDKEGGPDTNNKGSETNERSESKK